MPRKQAFDKQVEASVEKLLSMAMKGDLTEAQIPAFEARLKAVNAAITWAKVKHKIDEGSAGSAFEDPTDAQGDPA